MNYLISLRKNCIQTRCFLGEKLFLARLNIYIWSIKLPSSLWKIRGFFQHRSSIIDWYLGAAIHQRHNFRWRAKQSLVQQIPRSEQQLVNIFKALIKDPFDRAVKLACFGPQCSLSSERILPRLRGLKIHLCSTSFLSPWLSSTFSLFISCSNPQIHLHLLFWFQGCGMA